MRLLAEMKMPPSPISCSIYTVTQAMLMTWAFEYDVFMRVCASVGTQGEWRLTAVSTLCCVLQDDVAYLPDALPMALAAQAYAKCELLWYFRHIGDKLPPSSATPAGNKLTGQLLGQPKQHQLADDGHVVNLVAAAAAMFDLLVRTCSQGETQRIRCQLQMSTAFCAFS